MPKNKLYSAALVAGMILFAAGTRVEAKMNKKERISKITMGATEMAAGVGTAWIMIWKNAKDEFTGYKTVDKTGEKVDTVSGDGMMPKVKATGWASTGLVGAFTLFTKGLKDLMAGVTGGDDTEESAA